MNGCEGDNHTQKSPIGTIETRTFLPVTSPASATDSLNSAISQLRANPPLFSSGIIRLQVPILQKIEAIDWLHAQQHQLRPRCFFSGRSSRVDSFRMDPSMDIVANGKYKINGRDKDKLVSMAGVGSAVLFKQVHPFSYNDWKSIKRFLSSKCPLIRAYGAIRFDARTNISSEWDAFGSFYFVIPQVEFDELEGKSMLAATLAWDNSLSWTWEEAIDSLQVAMDQISSTILKLSKEVATTFIVSNNHMPIKLNWDLAVERALEIINKNSSPLIKVVLARSSKVVTATEIDPVAWLACLQVEGENSYQFCLQPPNAPAFIGNTPEQLFHRKGLRVSSEALAGTRARGGSMAMDLQIELDLLSRFMLHSMVN